MTLLFELCSHKLGDYSSDRQQSFRHVAHAASVMPQSAPTCGMLLSLYSPISACHEGFCFSELLHMSLSCVVAMFLV